MYAGPGYYRHFKGGLYHVMGLSTHTETGEVCVVYHGTVHPSILCHRPIGVFNEFKLAPGEQDVPRFEFLGREKP